MQYDKTIKLLKIGIFAASVVMVLTGGWFLSRQAGQSSDTIILPSEPTSAGVASPTKTTHIQWAQDVALNVSAAYNVYGGNPNYIKWPGINNAVNYENRTECASFVTRVLKQAYGLTDSDFKAWMGSASPTAAKYHDVINAANRFQPLVNILDLRAGDLIAVKYPAGSAVSGHTMIALGIANLRTSTAPLVDGTYQYEVPVVDSSQSGHGSTDTRRKADGFWQQGVGIGVFRIYADALGTVKGYTWSNYTNSTYYKMADRHLVMGRLL